MHCTGLPLPIVIISSAVSHEQYGNNDRWEDVLYNTL